MSGFGKLDILLLQIMKSLGNEVSSLCDIETIDGNFSSPHKQVLVYKDGSCASIFRYKGIANVIGQADYEEICNVLTRSLEPYFKKKGHGLQVVFRKDLDAGDSLDRIARIQKLSGKKLRLDVDDLIDENRNKYLSYVYEEDCYFVLYSRPALLDRTEIRMDIEEKHKIRRNISLPTMNNAQNILRPISFLYDRHISFFEKIFDDLDRSGIGCYLEKMDINEMLREVKRNANRDGTSTKWEAIYPGSQKKSTLNKLKLPVTWKESGELGDASEFLYPPIPEQILNTSTKLGSKKDKFIPDDEFVRIGSRVYAPIIINIPPRVENEHFNNLFQALNRAETKEDGLIRAIPYSISFSIEGDGLGSMMMKSLFSKILSFTSETNRNINLAIDELNERNRDYEVITKFKIAAMTWSKSDEESVRSLILRKTNLVKNLEGWGGAHVKEVTGDAALAWKANIPALSPNKIGSPSAAPLYDAVRLLPLTRPTTPFPEGTIVHRSLDGNILPFSRFADEQTTWVTLISGKPGSGKSVLMNNLNFESILSPGISRLPYIMIIDIGISSSGFIDTVRDALPEDLKHLVVYKRIQNTKEFAINVFDTPLGQRMPPERDLSFKVNFITTMVTPSEAASPREGMSSFVNRVIKETYRYLMTGNEKSRPKRYMPHTNKIVDDGLIKINRPFIAGQTVFYWDLVDAFFDAGLYYEAEVAQRYAVPELNDLVEVASNEVISSEYKGSRDLVEAFIRGLKEATEEYPIFKEPTRFELGSARVVSMDLQDVAGKDNSLATVKKTNLMYMIARQSFIQKIGYSTEDLPSFEPKYRDYFARIINQLVDEEKILVIDEYHKTQSASQDGHYSALQAQILTDAREARKWKMDITLGSQLITDFGEIIRIATNIFILDAGTPSERQIYTKLVGIDNSAETALVHNVHGPTRNGTTFLAAFVTKKGRFTQLLTSTIGPLRLWALSTTAEDRSMRNYFYSRIPDHKEARQALAYFFPSGGCKSYVDREKQQDGIDEGAFISEEQEAGIISRIAEALLNEWSLVKKNRAA